MGRHRPNIETDHDDNTTRIYGVLPEVPPIVKPDVDAPDHIAESSNSRSSHPEYF
jgi:hypothetical protein